jgi:hypothetical protein
VNMQTIPPTSYLVPLYKDTKIPLKIAEEMQLKALKGAEREAAKREGGRGNKNRYPIILVTGLVSFDAWTSTVGHDSHLLQQGWRTRSQKEQQKKDTYLIHYYRVSLFVCSSSYSSCSCSSNSSSSSSSPCSSSSSSSLCSSSSSSFAFLFPYSHLQLIRMFVQFWKIKGFGCTK